MKRTIAIFMAILMIFTLSTVAFAAQAPDNTVQPCWNYMNSITLLLNFSDDHVGHVDAAITPYFGITTRIEATITVYKMVGIDWVYVDSLSDYEIADTLAFDMAFPAVSGVMYKATLEVTSYGDDGSETEGVKKIRTCP